MQSIESVVKLMYPQTWENDAVWEFMQKYWSTVKHVQLGEAGSFYSFDHEVTYVAASNHSTIYNMNIVETSPHPYRYKNHRLKTIWFRLYVMSKHPEIFKSEYAPYMERVAKHLVAAYNLLMENDYAIALTTDVPYVYGHLYMTEQYDNLLITKAGIEVWGKQHKHTYFDDVKLQAADSHTEAVIYSVMEEIMAQTERIADDIHAEISAAIDVINEIKLEEKLVG